MMPTIKSVMIIKDWSKDELLMLKKIEQLQNELRIVRKELEDVSRFDCNRCKDEMRIDDYENGDIYSDDGKMPCPSCQE